MERRHVIALFAGFITIFGFITGRHSIQEFLTAYGPSLVAVPPGSKTEVLTRVTWETDMTQIPQTSGRFEWDLKADQVLMLTGGQFQMGDVFCGGDARQVCVLLFEGTKDQRIVVDSLVGRQNWVAITSQLNPDEALRDKEPLFWMAPNCITGCSKANVLFFEDGRLVKTHTLTAQ